MKQVVNLFELAPTVLIQFAIARQNVKRLEQLNRLIRMYFRL